MSTSESSHAAFELEFVDVHGRRVRDAALAGPWTETPDGRHHRDLQLGPSRRPAVQTVVSELLGRARPEVHEETENDVRCGVRLARRYAAAYPPELIRTLGYDIDAEVPFVLHSPLRGRPVAARRGLFLSMQESFAVGLLRSVALIADAGIVHGGLDPATVRWDGRSVQVCGFHRAVLAGERPAERPPSAFTAPEDVDGAAAATPATDVWAAAVLIHAVATGRPLPSPGRAPQLLGLVPALTQVLDAALTSDPAGRPDARALLDRLGAPLGDAPLSDVDAALRQAWRVFEAESAEKRSPVRPMVPGGRRG